MKLEQILRENADIYKYETKNVSLYTILTHCGMYWTFDKKVAFVRENWHT